MLPLIIPVLRKTAVLLLFMISIHAYAVNLDSLEASLKNGKIDTNRVKALNHLFLNYEYTDTAKAFGYLREALSLSQKLKYKSGEALTYLHTGFSKEDFGDYTNALLNYNKSKKVYQSINKEAGVAHCNISIANIYRSQSMFKEALETYKSAGEYYKKSNHEIGIATVYNNYGIIYDAMGDYKQATENFIKAVEIYEKLGNKYGLAASYCNIGSIFQSQQNWDMAISYFNKSIKICQEIGHKNFEGNNYNNLGDIYEAKKDLKTALDYHFKALKIRKEIADKFGMGSTLANIGGIYSTLDSTKQALKYIDEAEKIYLELGDKKFYTKTILRKAQLLIKLKRYPDSEKYVNSAISIAKEIDANNELSISYHTAMDLYDKMGKEDKALHYSKLYISIQDSVYSKENRKTIAELEKKYQSEKKDTEIKILNKDKALKQKEIERSSIIKNALAAGVLLVLLLLGVSVNAYLTKKKSNQEITLQKNEVEKQKQLLEIKNHEITQSIEYAQKIQSALLPNEEIFRSVLSDSFILFKPKDIVSGDYYWLSDKEKYTFYATADCTGHGVPGGFMSMLGTALLNEIVDERKIDDCGDVLTLMREKIMQALKQAGDSESKDGMDMVLIRINKQTLEMQYAAANNSLYIVSNMQSAISKEYCLLKTADCQLFELPCDKMPVGVYHSEVKLFRTFTHQLQKGDTIYTYTDGYADQFGGNKGKKYTYKRLREKLVAISQEPLPKQKNILESEFESWKNGQEQIDDVCLIGVKI